MFEAYVAIGVLGSLVIALVVAALVAFGERDVSESNKG